MLELHVTNPNVDSGSVAVGWCVDKSTLDYLKSQNVKNPMLVLILAPDGDAYNDRKEIRQVVPLKDLVAYLPFKASGKSKIWGFISSCSEKEAKNRYLSRTRLEYVYSILNYNGDAFNSKISWCDETIPGSKLHAEPVSIDIPKEAFAAPPPAWESEWVNHCFSSNPVDQCSYRRRRIFAYTLQPIIKLFDMVARALFLIIGLLIGSRTFTLSPLFHPLSQGIFNDTIDAAFTGGTIFVGQGKSKFLNWIRLPLMPIISIPLVCIIYALCKVHGLPILGMVLCGLICVILLVLGGKLIATLGARYLDKLAARRESAPAWYLDEEEASLVVCRPDQTKPFSFNELPKKHRTLRLRYANFKAKVCRPFSM